MTCSPDDDLITRLMKTQAKLIMHFLQDIGCDLQLRTSARLDSCGVCGGDGTSCQGRRYRWHQVRIAVRTVVMMVVMVVIVVMVVMVVTVTVSVVEMVPLVKEKNTVGIRFG